MFFNPLLRMKKKICNESDNLWMANPDIFESDDVANSSSVFYRTINQYDGTMCRLSFSRVNPGTVGFVWTCEFDLNTLHVDGEIWGNVLNPE